MNATTPPVIVAPAARSYPRGWDATELFSLREAPDPLGNFYKAYRAATRGTKRGDERIRLRTARGPTSLLTCRKWVWDYLMALSDTPAPAVEPDAYARIDAELEAAGL